MRRPGWRSLLATGWLGSHPGPTSRYRHHRAPSGGHLCCGGHQARSRAMSGIHQVVPMLHRGDAVGQHTLALQQHLVGAGVESRICMELDDPETTVVDPTGRPVPRRGRRRRPHRLPVRHGVGPLPVAGQSRRALCRELSQHHAAPVLLTNRLPPRSAKPNKSPRTTAVKPLSYGGW